MADDITSPASGEEVLPAPWYSRPTTRLLVFKINRRPLEQPSLPMSSQPEPLLAHLRLVLSEKVVAHTVHKGPTRDWRAGNLMTDDNQTFLAGVIGYTIRSVEETAGWDDEAGAWRTDIVLADHTITAPFAIVAATRYLYIAQHSTFSEIQIPQVFEELLDAGERQRSDGFPVTDWAVEPVIDKDELEQWLAETARLEKVTFEVRSPNPTPKLAHQQVADEIQAMRANRVVHTVIAGADDAGLNKNLESSPLTAAYMDLVNETSGSLRAKGTSATGAKRDYNSKKRVRRIRRFLPEKLREALLAIAQVGLEESPDNDDGGGRDGG